MKYQFDQSEIEFTFNTNGEVSFVFEGKSYKSVRQAMFDNSPNNNYSTYSAPLVCIDSEEPDEHIGKIEWDIINPDCDDEADACNWDKFSVYF